MTSYVPVVKNNASGAILYTSLAPRTASGIWQSNPTLAAGDVKISLDGGAFANLNTLPAVTPASGKAVKITLSQAETNADNIVILFSDASGAEWCDKTITIQTVSQQFNDLAAQSDVTAIKAKTDNLPSDPADASVIAGLIDALPTAAENATAVLTTAMTEAYSTDGATVTLAQALYELLARDQESSISGTTMTIKKRDGSTTAMTLTLNDADAPTSITRSA